jgi:hypothetical protein
MNINIKCQCNREQINCPNPAEYIMITGCLNQHLEEAPLCQKHLDYWIKCATGKEYSLLICDQCTRSVVDHAYIPISQATKEWLDKYIADNILNEILKQNTATTTTPPNNPGTPTYPTAGGWIGTRRMKHRNPPLPPGF